MQKALVLGFGISGRAAATLLIKKGWQVTATDQNVHTLCDLPDVRTLLELGLELFHQEESLDLSVFKLAVISPGIPPTLPLVRRLNELGIEVVGEIELAFRELRQPVIAITGTNGKTTVTHLISHILNASGRKARPLGNVGVPLSSELSFLCEDEIVVAELSSFQLETLEAPVIRSGVILNITPDHLDRYQSMDDYAAAKIRMKDCMQNEGFFLVEDRAFREFQSLFGNFPCQRYGYGLSLDFGTDLEFVYHRGQRKMVLPHPLQGSRSHDLENFMAAFAICYQWGVIPEEIGLHYATFQKPPHRIEFVTEIEGVRFYDDSKGTNIDAVIRAVERIQGPIVLIAGGVDKGAPYTPWIEGFRGKVKAVIAIGQSASMIERDLKNALSVYRCDTLQTAVQKAFSEAVSGDSVLLSPGCSSFDMFKDYAHRGAEFQRIVRGLCMSASTVL